MTSNGVTVEPRMSQTMTGRNSGPNDEPLISGGIIAGVVLILLSFWVLASLQKKEN